MKRQSSESKFELIELCKSISCKQSCYVCAISCLYLDSKAYGGFIKICSPVAKFRMKLMAGSKKKCSQEVVQTASL